MQKEIEKLKSMAKVDVVYRGSVFTVAKAFLELTTVGEQDLKIRRICAEGIARRSCLDPPNSEIGEEIAKGRALRALCKKIGPGNRIHHHYMG